MKIKFSILLILLSQLSLAQEKPYGKYIRIDTTTTGLKSEEIIEIKGDSIWYSQKLQGENVPPGRKFVNSAGEIVYQKKVIINGRAGGPHYFASLMVMRCDTCPNFWKYTLKSADSLNIEPYSYIYGKTDTIIKNGDTSFMTPEIIDYPVPIDFDRIRELMFRVNKNGDILMDDKIYRRKNKKY